MAGKTSHGTGSNSRPNLTTDKEMTQKTSESKANEVVRNSDEKTKDKDDGKEDWKVQGISEIKASLVYVQSRIDYIKEEFYGEPPAHKTKSKQKVNAAAAQRTKDGDIPTLVSSGFREMQIDEDGKPVKRYGPRPNPNKNNIGELVDNTREEEEEEVVEVKKKKKRRRKKKRHQMGRLVRLQSKYARPRQVAEPHPDSAADLYSESIITRLEYLGSTRDLLPGEQLDADPERYEVRRLADSGRLALVTGDAVYGISSPVVDLTEAHGTSPRPLKLPIINVNAGFNALKNDVERKEGCWRPSTQALPRIDHSLSAVKQYLRKLLAKTGGDRRTFADGSKVCTSTVSSTSRGQDDTLSCSFDELAGSSKGGAADRGATVRPEPTIDVGGSLHIAPIKPPGSRPDVTKRAEQEADAALFGQINWRHHLDRKAAFAHASYLTPACSQPPPTTPESNLSESESDRPEHDVMSVTLHNQLVRNSENPVSRDVFFRGRLYTRGFKQVEKPSREQDFSDLRLDIVHRPIREQFKVK